MTCAATAVPEGAAQAVPPAMEPEEPLLSTKLFVPPLRPARVHRPRLLGSMNSGLGKALVLISAPAGYGKTTLASSWLHEIQAPSSWIALDERDNDPVRFLQYFVSALARMLPAARAGLLDALRSASPAALEPLLDVVINEIAAQAGPCVVVLDDFHVIHDQRVLDAIIYLLKHRPPQLLLVIVSRIDPPLPLTHLRARNQLVDIRADHLRFTRDEIAHFLNEVAGLSLSGEEISALETRTEGWIAGLQLAAVSMQDVDDIHRFVMDFTGSHHYVMDYLTEEVLKRRPETIRQFLLQTSILGRLCGPLCAAVVDPGVIAQTTAQALLEDLERMNLFLVPLDEERRWYRYHHLFAEVLSRRLEHLYPHLPAELNGRASQWYEQHGFAPEAIQHALAGGNPERAIQLIEQHGVLLLIRGEVASVLEWTDAVGPRAQAHPWLHIFKAWAFALTGFLDRVEGPLRAAEELIAALQPTPAVRTMSGTIAAARAHKANVQGEARLAAVFARQALACLPDDDLVTRSLRAVATSLLGDASAMSGDLDDARQAYLESAQIGQAAGDIHLTIVVNSNLANILVEQGFLRKAARLYHETLDMATRPDGQRSIIGGRACVELSQVYYEWNQLDAAGDYARQSLALCRQWGNRDLQAAGHVMVARLEHIRRHPDQAQEAMRAAEQLANDYDLAPRHAAWVRSHLARLWIAQGALERAAGFVQKCGIDTTAVLDGGAAGDIPYSLEPGYFVLLRLLLARGDYAAAAALSRRLLRAAEAARRNGRVVEALALQALALQGTKDLQEARGALERAVSLAEPEGYVRVFLDEGEPMGRLLYQATAHHVGGGYVAELLAALGQTPGSAGPGVQSLIEPLTARELEVLQLIAAGCTNQDIAGRLFISLPTVKRHISNLYGKLGATNRTQAVTLARDIGLLE